MQQFINEMANLSYNPALAQDRFFDELRKRLDGDLTLGDVSNPYALLAEQSVTNLLAATSSFEMSTTQLLGLSNRPEDLFRFLNGVEDIGIFSYPATGYFDFYIELTSIQNNGKYVEELESYVVTIPKKSKISVNNIDYTILNNVNVMVKVTSNGWQSYIDVVNNDNLISFKHIGNVDSQIITDNNNIDWVKFTLPIKQIKLQEFKKDVILSEVFSETIKLENEYYLSSNVFISDDINGNYRPMKKSFSDTFTKNRDEILVQYIDNMVKFSTPILNSVLDNVDGSLKIELFTTKGKIFQPLNTYAADTFKLNIVNDDDIYTDTNAINVVVNSSTVVDGGYVTNSIEDFKKIIKHRITNHNTIPITEFHLKKMLVNEGFTLEQVLDSLTRRTFVGYKEPDIKLSTDIDVLNRIMNNTVELYIPNIDNKNIVITETDELIIKSNTIFQSQNGIVKPIDEGTRTSLLHYSQDILERVVNKKQLLFTPYYYIVSLESDVINCRVYDLDRPKLHDLNILRKNHQVPNVNGNIKEHEITKTGKGFKLKFTVTGNDEFNNLKNDLKLEASLPIDGTNERIYFYSEINDEGIFEFEIETNHCINKLDNILVTNGVKNLSSSFIKLQDKMQLKLFTTRVSISDDINSGELKNSPYGNYVFLSDHELVFNLGERLKYLWNKLSLTYSDKKYLKHDRDIPMVYDEDVYDFNGDCVTVEDTVEVNVLHHKGDVVVDDEGNTIFKHRKGDLVYADGKPIVNKVGGIVRYLDILMLDYKFKISKDVLIQKVNDDLLNLLEYWIKKKMVEFNDNVIDNTIIYYRPLLNYKHCKVKIGTNTHVVPNAVRPKVEIFTTDVNAIKLDESYPIIGKLIDYKLTNTYVDLIEIIDELLKLFNSTIKSIKISGIGNDFVTFKYLDRNRMFIPKKIEKNKIKYDYEVKIIDIRQ